MFFLLYISIWGLVGGIKLLWQNVESVSSSIIGLRVVFTIQGTVALGEAGSGCKSRDEHFQNILRTN